MARRETRRIDELKPNPKQCEYFRPASAERVAELAEDIRKNGLREPPAILPDGTILSGHTRIEAVKSLGSTEIEVDVYDDLANAPDAAEDFFLKENALRRQLSPLEIARCARRRMELAADGRLSSWQSSKLAEKTRDAVGRELGFSGRHMARLISILDTPFEVQVAYETKHLPIVDASRVAGFNSTIQRRIANDIRKQGVEKAREIIGSYMPKKAASPAGAERVVNKLLRGLHEAIPEIEGHEHKIMVPSARDLNVLQRAATVCGKLYREAKKRKTDFHEELDAFTDGLENM